MGYSSEEVENPNFKSADARSNRRREAIWRYSVAVCSVGAGCVLRLALTGVLGTSAPYLTLFPAVMFAAWFGGLGPAILATVLSLVAASFLIIPPVFHFALGGEEEIARTIIFLTSSILISALIEALRRWRTDAERGRDLLQTTLSCIGDGVIATDAAGKVTFLNAVAQQLTGWTQEDAKGRAISEVFVIRNENTGLPADDPVARAIREQSVVSLANDTILVDRAGREIPIEDTAAPILNLDRRLFGVVLVFRDVTARRRSEHQLKHSEERLQLVLDAGKIGAWDWSLAQNRIEWSDEVYEIHRMDRSAFSGNFEDYAKLVHPDDRERVEQAIDAALHRNAPYDIRLRIVRPTGEIRWVSTMGRVFRDDKGEPIRMLGAVNDITAQMQAEANLRQQWSTFDTALSSTPDHHFVLDLNGRLTYANHALLTLWQRTLGEVVGKNFFEIDYPPELASRFLRQVDDVILTRQPIRDQNDFCGPSGEARIYEYILVPALNADGEVEAVTGSSRDITDRIRSEKALRESEERLHFALEAGGGVGTWDWDIPSGRMYANAPFAHLFQVDPDLASGGVPIELFMGHSHPDDQSRIAASTRRAIETGGNFIEEYRISHPEGTRWIFARGRCHMDEAGNPTRFPGVAYDITDRKRAEEKLRQSQERLRAIFDSTYEFIGLLDPDGTLLEANRSSLEFARCSLEEVVGRKFWETPWFAFTPGAPEIVSQGLTRAAAGEFIRYEALINGPSGQSATFDISFYPIRNGRGEVILIVPEGRDITALKKVEEDLRQTNVELTRVNGDLEEFAYVASHDLREPLRTVSIYTQLLLKDFGNGDPVFTQYAASVRQGVARMDALLKDLLKFSRTVHSDDPGIGIADLAFSVSEALSVMKSRIEESGAVITVAPLPSVRGETMQLAHVFQNLISNALKYRRPDVNPQVHISARLLGPDWIVSVVDNGIGFEPDHADRIFGLFKRLHRDEYEGTGLGLAICRRIVERYGGRIWAQSQPGQGSTFQVALQPAETSATDEQASNTSTPA